MDHNDITVAAALGRIEGKLDLVLVTQADQERRIRGLEKRSAWVAGASAVLGAIGGYLSTFVTGRMS